TSAPPLPSTTTQRSVVVQAMSRGRLPASMAVGVHVGVVPAGSVVISTLPARSTAAHRAVSTQETLLITLAASITARDPHFPAPGSLLRSAPPSLSTATQRVLVEQETAVRVLPGSIATGSLQVGDAADGFVLETALPSKSTATQSELVGQERPSSARPSSIATGSPHVGSA